MTNHFQKSSISLKNLTLWDKNPRLPEKYFGAPERVLIQYFCSYYDIKSLGKEVAREFDLPQLEKFVVLSQDEHLIALEGNRRLVAYKLLANPDLAPSKTLEDTFLELNNTININDDFALECVVTEVLSEGLRFLDRKHLKGNNEVRWGDQERANHKVRRGIGGKQDKLKVEIKKNIIEKLDIPEEITKRILGKGYVTTFWRILLEKPGIEEFGLSLNDQKKLEVKDANFTKKLKVIISNLWNKRDFNGKATGSRSWNSIEERKQYLDSITEKHYKQADQFLDQLEKNKSTLLHLFDDQTTITYPQGRKIKINSKSETRKYLIPQSFRINIKDPKINNIYHELRNQLPLTTLSLPPKSQLQPVPNAVGVLFRVFLEISLDYFWEKMKGETFAMNTTFTNKITKITNYMEQERLATKDQLKNIRTVATNKASILSIENFHSYIHTHTTQPNPDDLKYKWDNLEKFFKILWVSLSAKK